MSPYRKTTEVWTQDPEDPDLWHGAHGVIVNTAALKEREHYYHVQRNPARLEVRPGKPSITYSA